MTGGDRFVRLCPKHGRELDGLTCPAGRGGPHHLEKWKVFDRVRKRVIGFGTVEKGGDFYPPGKDRPMSDKKEKKAGDKTLESKKLVDAEGNVLWLRLVQRREGRTPAYAIRWHHLQKDGAKHGKQGWCGQADSLMAGRAELVDQVERAERDGYTEAERGTFTGRSFELRAFPSAAGAPARRRA